MERPASLTAQKIVPALLTGCTIVLKPAPETPLDAYLRGRLLEEAGFPPGVVNVVPADRAVSEYLVSHPGVAKVTFTGSSAAGRRIAEIAARTCAASRSSSAASPRRSSSTTPTSRARRGAASRLVPQQRTGVHPQDPHPRLEAARSRASRPVRRAHRLDAGRRPERPRHPDRPDGHPAPDGAGVGLYRRRAPRRRPRHPRRPRSSGGPEPRLVRPPDRVPTSSEPRSRRRSSDRCSSVSHLRQTRTRRSPWRTTRSTGSTARSSRRTSRRPDPRRADQDQAAVNGGGVGFHAPIGGVKLSGIGREGGADYDPYVEIKSIGLPACSPPSSLGPPQPFGLRSRAATGLLGRCD